jgi:tetratricopeptide (TPR) repeat protein
VAARALGKQGKFDDAIACWHRLQQAKPEDEEARRAIGDLAVEKTIKSAGYENAESSTEVMADKQGGAGQPGVSKLTPEQQLEKQLKKDPSNTSLYLQLADIHLKAERFEQAEKTLEQALQVSGGEINIREQLEDAQIRRMRRNVEIARKKAGGEKEGEAVELYRKFKDELANLELEITRARCERYPQNLQYKFDLAVKLQAAKKYQDAIKVFQEARNDPQRKGQVLLHLGECFQHIEQFKLAMNNYAQAVDTIPDTQEDTKKTALYRAGVLCMGLKEYKKAEDYLTELAAREYGYKDVAERLDKLRSLGDKDQS